MTSTLYEMYQKEKEQYDASTLVAVQVGDEMVFLGDDATTASESLGKECHSYRIARGKSVPYLGLPMDEATKAFVTLFEQGITVAVAMSQSDAVSTETEPEVEPEPLKQEPVHRKRFERPTEPSAPVKETAVCARCGRPLSAADSVADGMGAVCKSHSSFLGGGGLLEHYASVSVAELPDNMIPISQLIKAARAIGISKHRMVAVLGGDRALRKPLLPVFQVHYYKHYRYVSKEALEHLEEARLK